MGLLVPRVPVSVADMAGAVQVHQQPQRLMPEVPVAEVPVEHPLQRPEMVIVGIMPVEEVVGPKYRARLQLVVVAQEVK